MHTSLLPLLVLTVALTACTPTAIADHDTPVDAVTTTMVTAPTSTTTTTTTTTAPPARSPLSSLVLPLGSAIYDPQSVSPPGPAPVSITIDGISVTDAPVIPVGVEPNGELEVPGAREVGWYKFGPDPREQGSAVLAAHVAFNGRNGVFRRLADVEIGSVVTIAYEDGSQTEHVVTAIAQYPKDELPLDGVFAKTGPPVLTLITCGGAFNPSLRSYDDNIVVTAAPLGG